MKKHFVTYLSPGTLVHEETTLPVDSWNAEKAAEQAHTIQERHGATPFGFYFTTRTRGMLDLDSKKSDESGIYYLGGEVLTRDEVEARNDPSEEILRFNMRANNIDRIIVNRNSWKSTHELRPQDKVLDWKPRQPQPAQP